MKKSWFVVFVFTLLSAAFLWGNLNTPKGGVMTSGAIKNLDDIYAQMNRHAKKVFGGREDGFWILYNPEEGLTLEKLEELRSLHNQLQEDLPEMQVVSLVNLPGFSDINGMTGKVNYTDTNQKLFKDSDGKFSSEVWLERLQDEFALTPSLVGTDGRYAMIAIYPSGNDEVATFQDVVESLEQRHISALGWFLKQDIYPVNSEIKAAGWVANRGVTDGAINRDILIGVGLWGFGSAFVVFFLHSRSFLQAGIVTFLVALSFAWMRGEIGLLSMSGLGNLFAFFSIKERVYTQLAYTVCIVQEVSFLTHMFDAYRELGDWRLARKSIWGAILKTATIAFIGFIIAYFTLPIEMIGEVVAISAICVINLVLIAIFLLPAIHTIFARFDHQLDLPDWLNLELIFKCWSRWCIRASEKLSPAISVAIMVSLALVITFFNHRIPIGGKPIEFVKGTSVWKASRFLNEKGKPGSTTFEFLVEPSDKSALSSDEVIHDSKFSAQVREFTRAVEEIRKVRTVSNINQSVSRISQQSFDMDFPNSDQLLAGIYAVYISDIDQGVRNQAYDPFVGYKMTVSTASDFVGDWADICDGIISLSKEYPMIRVSGFGNTFLYSRVVHYIVNGTVWNVLGDALNISIFYILCSAYALRRRGYNITSVYEFFKYGAIASVPFLFSSECLAVIMIIFKIPLDISTALIAPCALAAAVDFSIYFLDKFQELVGKGDRNALRTTAEREGHVVWADCVFNQALFAPLLSSSFLPVRRLGWMLVVMLFFSAVGSLIIMPPLLRGQKK